MSLAKGMKLGLNPVPVERLLFDSQNPRLRPEDRDLSQEELLVTMERKFDLVPIARSMVDNGYFQEEPLIGIPGPDEKLTVVEGSRRLACLKFLTEPKTRELSKNKDLWEELAEEAEKRGTLKQLKVVPIVIHEQRDQVRAILGFRHITSTKKWPPLQKGRFVNLLIETSKDTTFAKIAQEVGSKITPIRNVYVAFRAFLQATDDFNMDTSKVETEFGVFYTALTDPNIKSYLGLDLDKEPEQLKKPIPKSKAAELEFLIEALHGTKKVEPIITDSRQIKRLGEILFSTHARKVLQTTRNFDYAFRLTGGEKRALLSNLESADIYLTEAYKTAYRYGKDPNVRSMIKKCLFTAERMLQSLSENEGTEEIEEKRAKSK